MRENGYFIGADDIEPQIDQYKSSSCTKCWNCKNTQHPVNKVFALIMPGSPFHALRKLYQRQVDKAKNAIVAIGRRNKRLVNALIAH